MTEFNNYNKIFSEKEISSMPEELQHKVREIVINLENRDNLEEQIKILKESIHQETENTKIFKNKLLYAKAEIDNMRKEFTANSIHLIRETQIKAINILLPIADGLNTAIEGCFDELTGKGLNMFKKVFESGLKQLGVVEISETGIISNPNIHKIVDTKFVEEKQQDEVLEILIKGYKLADNHLLRPASVIVNSKNDK